MIIFATVVDEIGDLNGLIFRVLVIYMISSLLQLAYFKWIVYIIYGNKSK